MYIDDLYIGMEYDIPKVKIDKQKLLDFAKVYDPQPFHLDEEYAKNTRFKGLIAPGVMSFMSVWAEFVKINFFGDEVIAGKSTKIEWLKPVYPDDELSGKIKISNIERRNEYNGIVETYLEAYNQKGELVLTNVTESVVKYK